MSLTKTSADSDRDYLKVYLDDTVNISTVGGGDPDMDFIASEAGSVTITHNLGSLPIVRVFYDPEKNGVWYDSPADSLNEPWVTLSVTTTTVKIIVNSFVPETNIPVYYRIYATSSESVSSDDRMDKIFKQESLNGTVAASAFVTAFNDTTLTLPHGQSEVPCWTLQFSEDGDTWRNGGSRIQGPPDIAGGPPGGPYNYYATTAFGYADSTNFYIRLRSNYATAKTTYVRYALDFRS